MANFELSKAKSQSNDGEFDYNYFLVRLKKYSIDEKGLFLPLLDKDFDWDKWNISDYEYLYHSINAISLLAHEYTHFLDTTATTWGTQYSYRKILVLKEKNSDKINERLDVFKLNISEIKNLHEDFIAIDTSSYEDLSFMNHHYVYDENHGAIVRIVLNYDNKKSDFVPVSMLAVNEGHAFCNEFIYKYNLCKKINNKDLRDTLYSIIDKDFVKFLNSSNLCEYNILVKLAHQYFKNHYDNESILKIFSCILGFALDCNDIILGSLSYLFENTISKENIFVGQTLTQDMRRGNSRHFAAFKLILILVEVHNQCESFRPNFDNISKGVDPLDNLLVLIEFILKDKDDVSVSRDFVFIKEHFLELISNSEERFKNKYIFDSIFGNHKLYEESGYVVSDLNTYKLISFILNDDTIVDLNNSIDLDVEEYFLTDLDDNFRILDLAYEDIKKFHMSPQETALSIQSLRKNLLN